MKMSACLQNGANFHTMGGDLTIRQDLRTVRRGRAFCPHGQNAVKCYVHAAQSGSTSASRPIKNMTAIATQCLGVIRKRAHCECVDIPSTNVQTCASLTRMLNFGYIKTFSRARNRSFVITRYPELLPLLAQSV
jgi:hypothetical protein